MLSISRNKPKTKTIFNKAAKHRNFINERLIEVPSLTKPRGTNKERITRLSEPSHFYIYLPTYPTSIIVESEIVFFIHSLGIIQKEMLYPCG